MKTTLQICRRFENIFVLFSPDNADLLEIILLEISKILCKYSVCVRGVLKIMNDDS